MMEGCRSDQDADQDLDEVLEKKEQSPVRHTRVLLHSWHPRFISLCSVICLNRDLRRSLVSHCARKIYPRAARLLSLRAPHVCECVFSMAPARAFSRDRDLIILQQSQPRKEIGGEKRKKKMR